ncbi:MAG: SDR family oxidoreductase, partial [Thaumarchaeota archaeon]|nr:SDR family oxidoreductase [Nitrososphaerota archaeon]
LFPVRVLGIGADVTKKQDASRLIADSLNFLGGIDAVVCAAGFPLLSELWDRPLHEFEEDDLLNVFKVDVIGSFLVIKEALPIMIRQNSGVIVAFSSTPAVAGYEKGAPYTVAKAANLGLIKEIASEYGKHNIRAYAIAPGNIKTGRTFERLTSEEKSALANEAPMKRWGEPNEVGETVSALVSDKFSFVTGQTIIVDGGTVML